MHHQLANLSLLSGAALAQAIARSPAGVTDLNLSWNGLFRKTGDELAQAFGGIPASVTALNLSGNSLYLKTGDELAQAFGGIPASVTALNLSRNSLYLKTGAELAQAFGGIPASVTALNLSGNYLNPKTGAELAQAFRGIPAHISEITLSLSHIQNRTPEELSALAQALPYLMTLHVVDNHENPASHLSITALRSLIGGGYVESYRALTQLNLPHEVALLPLITLTGVPRNTIRAFIAGRAAAAQAHEQAVVQASYTFQFQCLSALSAVSVLTLALGIASLFLVTPVALGIGITAIGAVGALTSRYGLFTLAPPVSQDEPAQLARAERV